MSNPCKSDITSEVMKGLINGGVSPEEFFVGLHNVFYHGAILAENGYECSDKQLGDMFTHFDALISIVKKMH